MLYLRETINDIKLGMILVAKNMSWRNSEKYFFPINVCFPYVPHIFEEVYNKGNKSSRLDMVFLITGSKKFYAFWLKYFWLYGNITCLKTFLNINYNVGCRKSEYFYMICKIMYEYVIFI